MEVLLDTSFILTCLKERIDFLDSEKYGKLILALEVIEELENLAANGKLKERQNAFLALRIIEKNKDKFKIISLEKRHVDTGILNYVEGRKNIIVATIDRELKESLKEKAGILIIRNKKKLELS